MQALIGQKKLQSQRFLENGKRIPVTLIDVKGNTIVALKTQENDNYQAVQLGFSMKKKASRAEIGHVKGAKLTKAPKFLREIKIVDADEALPEVGTVLNPEEVFEPGDIVDVSGFSKGKGFQGGVRRWGFHGGPKTHGQSDRHRAPGSIGQGTTPGRVYKGKKMAGNMGNENITIKNLEVIDVTSEGVLIVKGLVPGVIDSMIMVKKVGKDKNFLPLYKTPEESAEQIKEEAKFEVTTEADKSLDQTTDESNDTNKPGEVSVEKANDEAEVESTEQTKDESEVEVTTEAEKPAEQNKEEEKDIESEAKEPSEARDNEDAGK
jgi:large subunit ribosomal protein L3